MLAARLDPLLCMQSRIASVLVSGSILVLPRDDGPQRSPHQRRVWTVLDPLTASTGIHEQTRKNGECNRPAAAFCKPLIAMVRFQGKFRKNLFSWRLTFSTPGDSVRHLLASKVDPSGVRAYLTQIPPVPGMSRNCISMAAAMPRYDPNSLRSTPHLTLGCSRRMIDRSLIRSWVWLRSGTKPRKNLCAQEPSVEHRLKRARLLKKTWPTFPPPPADKVTRKREKREPHTEDCRLTRVFD